MYSPPPPPFAFFCYWGGGGGGGPPNFPNTGSEKYMILEKPELVIVMVHFSQNANWIAQYGMLAIPYCTGKIWQTFF